MAKTSSDRRFNRRVKALKELREENPVEFRKVWSGLCRAWTTEIRVRAASGGSSSAVPPIFEVYDVALRLAQEVGAEEDVAEDLRQLRRMAAASVRRLSTRRRTSGDSISS